MTSDELEARDLTFSLSVGPGQSDCCPNRRFIFRDAAGERGDETGAGALDPWDKARLGLAPDHQVEFGDDLAGLDRVGTPASIAATVTVSAFVSKSRPIVIRRAIVLADGIL